MPLMPAFGRVKRISCLGLQSKKVYELLADGNKEDIVISG